jgi:spore maturation protein CgeB
MYNLLNNFFKEIKSILFYKSLRNLLNKHEMRLAHDHENKHICICKDKQISIYV